MTTLDDSEKPGLWAPGRTLGPALLAALALAVFCPSLRNGLTNWDDVDYVTRSPLATRGLAGIPASFTQPYGAAYYPLTHSLYCLVHAVAGDAPLPYHALQLVLFALAAALVPSALATFGVPRRVGFWAAVLWAVHPQRVESVAWVANLKDALSVLFVFGAFALHGSGRRRLSVVAWCAALLSKSMVFPLALLVPLLEARGGARPGRAAALSLPWLIPAGFAAGAAAVFHLGAPSAQHTFPGGTFFAALPTVAWLPWQYLGMLLIPRHPQAVYAFTPVGWLDGRLAAAGLLWALWGAVVWSRRGRPWPWLAGTAAWALPFAAVTGLVPRTFQVADRYTLLPSLALAAGLALAGDALARRFRPGRFLAPVAFAAAAAALGAGTLARIPEWRSGVTLWEADRAHDGSTVAVRLNLAGAYGGEGRWRDATRELELLRRIDPSRLKTVSDLFFACAASRDMPAERIDAFVGAIDKSGKDPRLLRTVSESVLKEGHLLCAAILAEAAYGWNPGARTEALMATIELAKSRFEPAAAHARAALALDSADESPRVTLALALVALGRTEEALAATATPAADPRIQQLLQTARTFAQAGAGKAPGEPGSTAPHSEATVR